VKAYIVQSLAMFSTPSEVASTIKKEFGLALTVQRIEAYDPTKTAGGKLCKRWVALFAATRQAFSKEIAEIAISHRTVRLRALERMAEKAEASGNLGLAAHLLEQAANEVGNAYTNRSEITGKNTNVRPAQSPAVIVIQSVTAPGDG
jgi:Uncharacterized conserved protein